ncbi:hypothetical protein [Hymenobacter cavernae]|uniref:Uncharacterized protein n=1 Tax=Hymenobacter cavernae TaxID=2044852 RepID=A0ABQ1U849_9BACT|nr:hypothetical protein [Hymenobacter cavernae]GGF11446.1 hypothetical protein GCM10011383_23340 [Hymenobacter cavernae]
MKKLVLLSAMLVCSSWAFGQTKCADYDLKVYQNGQEVDMKNSPLVSSLSLVLVNDPDCAQMAACQFRSAELTLVREKTPVLPAIITDKPDVDLTEFQKVYQPGDRLVIEVEGSTDEAPADPEQEEQETVGYSVVVNWSLQ